MNDFSRRSFLLAAPTLSALGAFALRGSGAQAQPTAKEIASQPFARVVELGPQIWAVESTPATGNMTTVCNGGIIAGSEGVLVLEAYNTPAGAAWAAELSQRLTGRPPTHVVLTHYHADHSAGLQGYQRASELAGGGSEPPEILTTPTTRDLLLERSSASSADGQPDAQLQILPNALIAEDSVTELDLGGRKVSLLPRGGHTPSDVAVRVDDPAILWCGDLVFLGLFPNYVDAIPTRLADSCYELLRDRETTFVPGHGPITDHEGVQPYLDLIELIEEKARGLDSGRDVEQLAANFEIPENLGQWSLFREGLIEDALRAWERDLGR
jgi:glyoxylase-like metal-dependent hydrolase (beta-lactamase superfamily II)